MQNARMHAGAQPFCRKDATRRVGQCLSYQMLDRQDVDKSRRRLSASAGLAGPSLWRQRQVFEKRTMTHTNRFAPPTAQLCDISEKPNRLDIESLPVSDPWKQKFRLLEKAGGPKQPNLKGLSSGERLKIGFNILAFLFGPLYYLAKGMWKKALALFGACVLAIVVIGFALELFGLTKVANALGYGAAAVFAVRANVHYYKKMVLGENGWW